ncbi:spectrin alpha chain-like [Sycon ciliatum]|uniref:spectrin alpha chain-like n=1 Tax=Sycon ciliatum TaxID=27933 RepID=UPI0031F63643
MADSLDSVADIQARRANVQERYTRFREAAEKRKLQLRDGKRYQEFRRDADELDGWITDQLQTATDEAFRDTSNLQGKIQKHEAFQAEVTAHANAVQALTDAGKLLVDEKHFETENIQTRVTSAEAQYALLVEKAKERGIKLNEALKLVQFQREVDEVRQWIVTKEPTAASDAYGNTVGEVQTHQKKFNDFRKDMAANSASVEAVHNIANKLASENHPDIGVMKEKLQELDSLWDDMQQKAGHREQRLTARLAVQMYLRDASEAERRVNDRDRELTTDELGADLTGVMALQKKHKGVESAMEALRPMVEELAASSKRLQETYPDDKDELQKRESEIVSIWDALTEKAKARSKKLSESFSFRQFQNKCRDLMAWCESTCDTILTESLADTVAAAESQLKRHRERKGEMEARQENFTAAESLAEQMTAEDHYATADIQDMITKLNGERSALSGVWQKRQEEFGQCLNLQIFTRDMVQMDSWMKKQESFLENTDLGDSLGSVEGLLKKHGDFENQVSAQEEKITELMNRAKQMVSEDHYANEQLIEKQEKLEARHKALLEKCASRKDQLTASLHLQKLKRDFTELKHWITDQMKVAQDETFKDLTNLQDRVQKHKKFDAEVSGNSDRLARITNRGDELIGESHYASDEIRSYLEDVKGLWETLTGASSRKGTLLDQAVVLLKFNKSTAELNKWFDDVELQLSSTELGKDLASVKVLQTKHQALQSNVESHQAAVSALKKLSEEQKEEHHYALETIEADAEKVATRFGSLTEPMAARTKALSDSLELQLYLRDSLEEHGWIAGHLPNVSAVNRGTDVPSVQALMKKHDGFQVDTDAHKSRHGEVCAFAERLTEAGHYAKDDIEPDNAKLAAEWQELQAKSEYRKRDLAESLKEHQYFADARETESWLKEKETAVASTDFGAGVDAAQELLKKLKLLRENIDSYKTHMDKLAALCSGCQVSADDTTVPQAVTDKQKSLEERYEALLVKATERRVKLEESKSLHKLKDDAAEVDAYVADRSNVASSTEVGDDLDRVEQLQKNFSDFKTDLLANENRVKAVDATAMKMVEEGHSQKDQIDGVTEALKTRWSSLLDGADQRKALLDSAHQVQTFNRDAGETLGRIADFSAQLDTDDCGNSLPTVQSLIRSHEVFERNLAAVQDKVAELANEADRLKEAFPRFGDGVMEKNGDIQSSWSALQKKSAERKAVLLNENDLQVFLNNARSVAMALAAAESSSSDFDDHLLNADVLQAKLDDFEKDLSSYEAQVQASRSASSQHAAESHPKTAPMSEKEKELIATWDRLQELRKERQAKLTAAKDVEQFIRETKEVVGWMNEKSTILCTILSSDDYGDNVAAVQALLKTHEGLEQDLSALHEKVKQSASRSSDLQKLYPDSASRVTENEQEVSSGWTSLREKANARQAKLDDSLELQLFLSSVR